MSKAFKILPWIGNRNGKAPGLVRVMRRLMPPEKCGALGELCLNRDAVPFRTRPDVPLGGRIALFGT